MPAVCVFCGSNPGAEAAFTVAARKLAEAIVDARADVVFGGSNVGLMAEVADAALARGGRVVGVIPEALVEREIAHRGLSELQVVATMHERKAVMAELADAFVALPGGFGTLDELFEVLSWGQLGLHDKPCGLLDVGGYWQPLVSFLDHAVAAGFVRPRHREMLLVDDDPGRLLRRFAAYHPPVGGKWLHRSDL